MQDRISSWCILQLVEIVHIVYIYIIYDCQMANDASLLLKIDNPSYGS